MDALDPPFHIEDTGRGFRCTLQPRQLGDVRKFAWVSLVFGLFGVVFMGFWMGTPIRWGIDALAQGQDIGWFFIGFGLMGLPGMLMALGTVVASIAVLKEKTFSVVEVRDNILWCTEKFGWFFWRRKKRIDEIDRLVLDQARPKNVGRIQSMPLPNQLLAILASGQGKQLAIGIAYPRAVLEPLAQQLATRIDRQLADSGSASGVRSEAAFVGVTDNVSSVAHVAVDLDGTSQLKPQKPGESTIVRHDIDGAIVYEIPSMGVWKGSKGLVYLSLLWNGLMVLFTATMLSSVKGQGDFGIVVGILVVFWGIGIGILLTSLNMGRKSTMMGIVGDEFYVRTKSIFGEKDQRFGLGEVTAVEVGPSGMEINDVPVRELQLQTRQGQLGFLANRSDDELVWLAYELNDQLNLNRGDDGEAWKQIDSGGELVEPAAGRVNLQSYPERAEITVPALGFGSYLGLLIPGVICLPLGVWLILLEVMGPGWIGNPFGGLGDLPAAIFGSILVLFGLVFLVVWRVLASRFFRLTATRSQLTIERYGFLSRKTLIMDQDDVEMIDRQKSGVSVNDRPLDQLLVASKQGVRMTLMTGWQRFEIDYVAFHLNRILRG